jgi:uncharacterized membrane protein YebE (DUF533 family)
MVPGGIEMKSLLGGSALGLLVGSKRGRKMGGKVLKYGALARSADSPQARREIYAASVAIIDEQNPMERAWLNQLATALQLEPALAAELERQVLNTVNGS